MEHESRESADQARQQAEELDDKVTALLCERRFHHAAVARVMYEMGEQYSQLGYRSFSAYLDARGIPRSWAYFLRQIHRKLAIEFGLAEEEWENVPLANLQGCLQLLTPSNVRGILYDSRIMGRMEFRDSLRQLRGEQGRAPGAKMYQLVPVTSEDREGLALCRRAYAYVYEAPDGKRYAEFRA